MGIDVRDCQNCNAIGAISITVDSWSILQVADPIATG